MRGTDAIIRKETLKIAAGTVMLCAVMDLIFLFAGAWDKRVLFGSLLGAFTAILNFFLMCLTVKRAVNISDSAKVAARVRASQLLRLLMQLGIMALAAVLREKVFNLPASVIPLVFPGFIIRITGLISGRRAGRANGGAAGSGAAAGSEGDNAE